MEKRLDRQVTIDQRIEAELQEKICQLEDNLKEANAELSALRGDNAALEAENDDLRAEMAPLKQENRYRGKLIYGRKRGEKLLVRPESAKVAFKC